MSDLAAKISVETGLGQKIIMDIVKTAPHRYKTFRIPKKNGGLRTISQPSQELKMIQRAFVELYLNRLPIHSAATAYRRGRSIRYNASQHAGYGPVLKLDFKDFFPSIKANDWLTYCDKNKLFSRDELHISSLILFQKLPQKRALSLAIGAPSSPVISNLLMSDFDRTLTEYLEADSVTYTRYADDLTFSATRTGYLTRVTSLVKKAIKHSDCPKLTINREKTVLATQKYRRSVTGLILANDGRVTIGRDKKRIISATTHRAKQGILSIVELEKLSGMLAHINSVEPDFLLVLKKKYGDAEVTKIQKICPQRRYRL